MIRCSLAATGLIAIASSASAEQVLLASFHQEGGFGTTNTTARVGFVLSLFEDDIDDLVLIGVDPSASSWPYVQPNRFWEEGETGVLEFTASNEIGFGEFSQAATDGIDNNFVIWNAWDIHGIGGQGGKESGLFDLPTDLVGHTLESVRLTVNEIKFDPQGALGREWHWNITYEFYGSPIPEPATLTILVFGLLFVGRRTDLSEIS